MCAINPVHKKRFILDVYTSDKSLSLKEFEDICLSTLLCNELRLNSIYPRLRFHLKETEQEAD